MPKEDQRNGRGKRRGLGEVGVASVEATHAKQDDGIPPAILTIGRMIKGTTVVAHKRLKRTYVSIASRYGSSLHNRNTVPVQCCSTCPRPEAQSQWRPHRNPALGLEKKKKIVTFLPYNDTTRVTACCSPLTCGHGGLYLPCVQFRGLVDVNGGAWRLETLLLTISAGIVHVVLHRTAGE